MSNGTLGRVYGGDCELIHVRDGHRTGVGRAIAAEIDMAMCREALASGTRSWNQVATQQLCPGCYMVVGFNAMVTLARSNGQSLSELGRTMAAAFSRLAECQTDACIEEILVLLDE